MNKYKSFSIFSGAGGFDLGFELSGRWRTTVAIDSHPVMVRTLEKNKGLPLSRELKFLEDTKICNLDLSQIDTNFILQHKGVDLVLGGPPCQDFSAVGKQQGYEHNRGSLIDSFKKIVELLRPSMFLFENVPNMNSSKWNNNFNIFCELLTFSGKYKVKNYLLNCADYGAATVRERIFILGIMGSLNRNPSCPSPSHIDSRQFSLFEKKPTRVSVKTALAGLPNPSTKFTEDSHFAPIHETEVIRRFMKLKPGERDHFRRRNRLIEDLPSLTLFAGGEKGGTRAHIHPTEPRELTPRECARIHGFPDAFLFSGNKSQIAIQIANSVPVPIAKAWGQHLAELLDSCK